MSRTLAMLIPMLFGLALFLNSLLLLILQPLIGRILLPHVGGSEIGWSACVLFLQSTLFAGAVHAHCIHRFQGLRWQTCLQLFLMTAAAIGCVLGLVGTRSLQELAPRLQELDHAPWFSASALLIVVIGFPCLVLAAIGPLLQRWFAHLDHWRASDPYFLQVASNLGGLTALVAYPLIIEPYTTMTAQGQSWTLALAALTVLIALVSLSAWRSPRNPELESIAKPEDPNAPLVPHLVGRGPTNWGRRFLWFTASALPVGMVMGLTEQLTHNAAPVPFLWVLPLGLYLFAHSQAFARSAPFQHANANIRLLLRVLYSAGFILCCLFLVLVAPSVDPEASTSIRGVLMVIGVGFVGLLGCLPSSGLTLVQPVFVIIVVVLQLNLFRNTNLSIGTLSLTLGCYALSLRVCLERVAESRPAAPYVTSFYTWCSAGGICGGLFQLLMAPLMFRREYLEFLLFASLAMTLRLPWLPNGWLDTSIWKFYLSRSPTLSTDRAKSRLAMGFDVWIGLVVGLFGMLMLNLRSQCQPLNLPPGRILFPREFAEIVTDVPLLIAVAGVVFLLARPLRAGLALSILICFGWIGLDAFNKHTVVSAQRTSFGITLVKESQQPLPLGDKGVGGQKNFTERVLCNGSLCQTSSLPPASPTHYGSCITEPPELRRSPTGSFHRKGPVGVVMRHLEYFQQHTNEKPVGNEAEFWLSQNRDNARDDVRIIASLVSSTTASLGISVLPLDAMMVSWSEPSIAMIGLGSGSIFAYTHPWQWVDTYELDPTLITLSTEEQPVFHYYRSAIKRGVHINLVDGDARRNLARSQRDQFYQVIFLDARSPNAFPVHLLTKQAIELYFRKLAPGGVLCIHTSNSFLNLPMTLDKTARQLEVALHTFAMEDLPSNIPSYITSEWVVLARHEQILQRWGVKKGMDRNALVRPLNLHDQVFFPSPRIWTDEHASLMSVMRRDQDWSIFVFILLIALLLLGVILGAWEMIVSMAAPARLAPTPPAKPT